MLLIAAAVLLMQAEAPGAAPAPSPTTAQKAAGTRPADGDKVICRSEVATGSMFGGPKECHTKSEWAAINAESRDNVNSFQQRSFQNSGPH